MQPRANGAAESGKEAPGRPFPARILLILLILIVFGVIFSILCVSGANYFSSRTFARPSFELCSEEAGGIQQWVRPPMSLGHWMTDEELLWRASFSPAVEEYPFKREPKIAFLFLARGPLPLAPLWELFFRGKEGCFSIYIHSLPSYKPKYPSNSVFFRRQVPSQVSEWGKMNMVDAERRLLANALLDISNEWFVLLSESCIPLYNFNAIYDYLKRSKYSFMGSFDDPGPYGRGRYNARMAPEVTIKQWRKGSQWFEVNRKLAIDIIKDNMYYPKFRDFCKPACYVDEHYFPTMLTIETPRLMANRSITWVDWARGGAHPATYGKSDITASFFRKPKGGYNCTYNDRPTSLCHLFARKFALNSLERLLQLAPDFLDLDVRG